MNKTTLLTTLAILGVATVVHAADFPITAKIPSATTVSFGISKVTPGVGGAAPSFEASTDGNNLNFSTAGTGMKYDTDNNIWTGTRFFAVDLSPSTLVGGVNTPAPGTYDTISFSYANTAVPAGQTTGGLDKRATLTAVKVVGKQETPLISARNIGGTLPSLSNSDVLGGFLRVYVGLATGELISGTQNPVAAGSQPFTNADKPGTYTGTLTITATLL